MRLLHSKCAKCTGYSGTPLFIQNVQKAHVQWNLFSFKMCKMHMYSATSLFNQNVQNAQGTVEPLCSFKMCKMHSGTVEPLFQDYPKT